MADPLRALLLWTERPRARALAKRHQLAVDRARSMIVCAASVTVDRTPSRQRHQPPARTVSNVPERRLSGEPACTRPCNFGRSRSVTNWPSTRDRLWPSAQGRRVSANSPVPPANLRAADGRLASRIRTLPRLVADTPGGISQFPRYPIPVSNTPLSARSGAYPGDKLGGLDRIRNTCTDEQAYKTAAHNTCRHSTIRPGVVP
jgi:hypothetical protein